MTCCQPLPTVQAVDFLWADGPRVFEGVGPIKLELAAATSYASGVVCLRYRPAGTTT